MKIPVLDHGYVELIECWGAGKEGLDLTVDRDSYNGEPYAVMDADYEVGIIEAARQSTQGSFRGWAPTPCSCDSSPHSESCSYSPGDARLLRHLYSNNHMTPFEFSGMIIEVQAPLMVFREWHRHRTQWYNEMSARYAPLPDLYYHCPVSEVLERSRVAAEAKDKQHAAASWSKLDEAAIEEWCRRDSYLSQLLEQHYQTGLAIGIPKELARKKMPVDHYSRMRAGANLRNWLGFERLRLPANVMPEMRQYAEAVAHVIAVQFPHTWEQFNDECRNQV